MADRVRQGWRTWLGAALVLLLAFFGTSAILSARGGTESVAFVEPDLAPRDQPASAEVSGVVRRAIALGTTLSGEAGRVRALCLEEQGYPHLTRALEARRVGLDAYERRPLEVVPLEFGPSTHAEAAAYGFAGGEVALDDGDLGKVLSKDPRFDALTEACEVWLYEEIAPALSAVQSRAASLAEQATRQYHDELVRELAPVAARRVTCVQETYPALPGWRTLRDLGEQEVLARLGITPGRVVDGDGVAARMSLVRPGTVRMFPPLSPPRYRATPAEVGFGRAYADCGRAVAFSAAVEDASRRAAARVERAWRERAERLTADIEVTLEQLRFSR